MIKVKTFKSTSEGNLDDAINEFIGGLDIVSFDQIRIHYSSNRYGGSDSEHYSALMNTSKNN